MSIAVPVSTVAPNRSISLQVRGNSTLQSKRSSCMYQHVFFFFSYQKCNANHKSSIEVVRSLFATTDNGKCFASYHARRVLDINITRGLFVATG